MAAVGRFCCSTVTAPAATSVPRNSKTYPIPSPSLPPSPSPPPPLALSPRIRNSGLAFASAVAAAAVFPLCASAAEPSNALSLPTWAIHVSSVAEWVTAMVLVWEYGEKSEYKSWKGLSWGMEIKICQVPLLGGALCACTWHFFYNAESLEVLVALQGVLTVVGNVTMCIAAYRIYKFSQSETGNP